MVRARLQEVAHDADVIDIRDWDVVTRIPDADHVDALNGVLLVQRGLIGNRVEARRLDGSILCRRKLQGTFWEVADGRLFASDDTYVDTESIRLLDPASGRTVSRLGDREFETLLPWPRGPHYATSAF